MLYTFDSYGIRKNRKSGERMIHIKAYNGYQYKPRRGYMSVTKLIKYKMNPVGIQYFVNYAQITAIKPVDQ